MHRLKVIVILWIFNLLITDGVITADKVLKQFDLTNRQLWRYMSNIKKYFKEFGGRILIYDKSKKEYRLIVE